MKLMKMKNKLRYFSLLILIIVSVCIVGCSEDTPSEVLAAQEEPEADNELTTNQMQEQPQEDDVEAAPQPTVEPPLAATPTPESGEWTQLAPGIKRRYIPVEVDDEGAMTNVYALKLNPEQVTFKVLFSEGEATNINDWRVEANAPLVVNGGFFTGDYDPVGRVIEDGVLNGFALNYGRNSAGVPGMFTVLDDGLVNIYSLGRVQFVPRDHDIWQAIECYPMLLLPGGQPVFTEETFKYARRTAIGIDYEGDVVVLVVDQPIFTLYQFSHWLAASDMQLDQVLNLDGGRSSGLAIATPGETLTIPAYVDLPGVLAVYTGG